MKIDGNEFVVASSDIGRIRAGYIFMRRAEREGCRVEDLDKLQVRFQNGPETSSYTQVELQHLLDLMGQSCSETDVLRELGIVPGYRGHLPPAWKAAYLYRGDQEFLLGDIWLDESAVCRIARRLHSMQQDEEEHCVTVVLRETLPEELFDKPDQLTPEQVREHAAIVIRHGEIIFSVPSHRDGWGPRGFGELAISALNGSFLALLEHAKFTSTRLHTPASS